MGLGQIKNYQELNQLVKNEIYITNSNSLSFIVVKIHLSFLGKPAGSYPF
ncbi:hypothetical protein FM107_17305 [Sphingobacterium sp. JB170]|nr:hypothetical protein FM107_17305 [Sphingobacterium sp. JB170]